MFFEFSLLENEAEIHKQKRKNPLHSPAHSPKI